MSHEAPNFNEKHAGRIRDRFGPGCVRDMQPRGREISDLPTFDAAVNQMVSPENRKSAASKATDPDVLLGLDYLAEQGNTVRREIAEMVVKAKPEYAPIVAVLAVRMETLNEKAVAELVKSDPDNAYGYYLQGNLMYEADKEQDALAAFRKGAACPELRLYENVTGPALFKGLDALGLKGRDRLCALSWVATRAADADIGHWQPAIQTLAELTHEADLGTRKEISEILLLLAGHVYATNFVNRDFAERALEYSFRYKTEAAAAEKSPAMNGYAAVTEALVSVQMAINQPGFLR